MTPASSRTPLAPSDDRWVSSNANTIVVDVPVVGDVGWQQVYCLASMTWADWRCWKSDRRRLPGVTGIENATLMTRNSGCRCGTARLLLRYFGAPYL